jgi:hypothetical protein
MAPIIQSPINAMLACLALLFCYGSNAIHVFAQNSEVLSRRPPVIRIFDPDKNESTVSSFLFDPQSTGLPAMVGADPFRSPPNMRLHSVEYTYPGNIPTRPQVVAFVFVPLDKYKSAPSFSITADGTVLNQGEAALRELCCVEVNGRTQNPQHIIVAVPMEIFERMTQAKKIELKLSSKAGKYSFKLNDNQRKSLTALASTIK